MGPKLSLFHFFEYQKNKYKLKVVWLDNIQQLKEPCNKARRDS